MGGGLIRISGTTELVGIIGDPVRHSLSPAIHNAAFAALGLDMAYVPLRVAADQVGAAVLGLRALGFRGANVTVPHKAAVVPFLDSLEGDAALIGAVNTIVAHGAALRGHNTDVEGVRRALHEACGDGLRGHKALLLGAGGAARAAALALARLEMRLTIVNRSPEAAERLAALVATAVPGAACEVAPWQIAGRRPRRRPAPAGQRHLTRYGARQVKSRRRWPITLRRGKSFSTLSTLPPAPTCSHAHVNMGR